MQFVPVLLLLSMCPATVESDVPREAINSAVRTILIDSMPNPLLEDSKNWGHTVNVANGVTWRKGGGSITPKLQKKPKNHGKWQKVRVTTPNLANNLVFDLRKIRKSEGTTHFEVFIAFDCDFDYTQQNWESGVKLFDGSIRGRCRILLTMQCELRTRVEKSDSLLPDIVIQVNVASSDLRYEKLVFEHVAGLGGEVAERLGKTAHACLTQWKPSIERNLIQKANQAIIKAGQNKEVRISFSKLLG